MAGRTLGRIVFANSRADTFLAPAIGAWPDAAASRAIVATGNSVLTVVYHLLSTQTPDSATLGPATESRINKHRRARDLATQLQALTPAHRHPTKHHHRYPPTPNPTYTYPYAVPSACPLAIRFSHSDTTVVDQRPPPHRLAPIKPRPPRHKTGAAFTCLLTNHAYISVDRAAPALLGGGPVCVEECTSNAPLSKPRTARIHRACGSSSVPLVQSQAVAGRRCENFPHWYQGLDVV